LGGPTPGRAAGGVNRLTAPSPTPGKFGASLRARSGSTSVSADPNKRSVMTPKPNNKRLGVTKGVPGLPDPRFDEPEAVPGSVGVARTSNGSHASNTSFKGLSNGNTAGSDEAERLRKLLDERDKQLKEQAASLAEMETSFLELQSLIPNDGGDRTSSNSTDIAQLRTLLKNRDEKVALLTSEFDSHRADFRSTIDALEVSNTETIRVYEKKIEELVQVINELQDRTEDVDSVAIQFKQLEDLVQELEEGVESARRGEAEARGEAEFLRGEVERGRAELRREREKAAAALKGAGAVVNDGVGSPGGAKEVEQRDDEIRGLKAIIHSLSRDAIPDTSSPGKRKSAGTMQAAPISDEDVVKERLSKEKLERRLRELEGLIERKTYREEELERELERLRGTSSTRISTGNFSEKASLRSPKRDSGRDSKGTIVNWRHAADQDIRSNPPPTLESTAESDTYSSDHDGVLWCEICETSGHDILTCTNMFGNQGDKSEQPEELNPNTASPKRSIRSGKDNNVDGPKASLPPIVHPDDKIAPLSPLKKVVSPAATPKATSAPKFNPHDTAMVAGKESGVVNPSMWCALCEKDGHESVDCPFEDNF
jgi:Fe-S-cluster formation regulator IscX/YfhJ